MYVVKKGDTLYSIARKNGISVDTIKKLNGLTTNVLSVGQVLKLKEDQNSQSSNTYIVKPGDTLYGISNQFGVSVTELAKLNDVSANTLQIGQVLFIPSSSGFNPDNMFLYTVKRGDSLYSIAMIYNTTVDEIKKLNYLSNDNLYVGQVLRIPEMYTKPEDMNIPQFVNYTVKKGDSLYSIADKYKISVNQVMQDNALSNSILKVGQNLKIRIINGEVEVEECFGDNSSLDTVYIVQKGDSLYSIAKKYSTNVDSIKTKNNLNNNNLYVGQKLKI